MKIFFVENNPPGINTCSDMGVKNFLISYWYERQLNLIDKVYSCTEKPNIFLDSGAYSAMTQDITIDIDEYIDFCKENKSRVSLIACLDVIGDPEASRENFDIMTKAVGALFLMHCTQLIYLEEII